MLCDDLMAASHPRDESGNELFDSARVDLKTAARFILDKSAVFMTHNLSDISSDALEQSINSCRLPYSTCWVEFADADRRDWLATLPEENFNLLKLDKVDFKIRRTGYLLKLIDEEPYSISVYIFGGTNNSVVPALYSYTLDLSTYLPKTSDKTIKSILNKIENNGGVKGVLDKKEQIGMINLLRRISYKSLSEKYRNSDGSISELKFLIGLILAFNVKNLFSVGEPEDVTKLNKARARSGKLPLLICRPVTIDLSPTQRRRLLNPCKGDSQSRHLMPHAVRGHFKVLKSGIPHWWNPHIRGGDDAPARDYRVKASNLKA